MARVPAASARGEESIFYKALESGHIVFQVCEQCGAAVWYLRTVCPACMGTALRLETSAGRGAVHSLTTIHRAGDPARVEDLPYTVALVDLDEGVRVIGDLEPGPRIGDRVAGRALPDGIVFVGEGRVE